MIFHTHFLESMCLWQGCLRMFLALRNKSHLLLWPVNKNYRPVIQAQGHITEEESIKAGICVSIIRNEQCEIYNHIEASPLREDSNYGNA